jgi:cytochrome P450
MVAGFDTSSSIITIILHILTTHREELEKIQAEIDTLVINVILLSSIK